MASSPTSDAAEKGLKKKLIRDSVNYFISKVIPGLMGLVSVLVFVRLVGNEEYGKYSVLLAIVTACAAGLSAWLPQGILRFFTLSHAPHEGRQFKMATLLGSLLSILAGAFVLCIVLRFKKEALWTSTLGVLLLAATVLYAVFLIELQAMLKSERVVIVEAVRSIACFVFPVGFILSTGTRSAPILLAGVSVGFLVPLLGYPWKQYQQGSMSEATLTLDSWKGELRLLRTIWTYGWPVGIWSMCLTVQSALDRYLIQRYSGNASAGNYAAMYDVIVRSFTLLCFPLVLSSNSLVMAQWNKNDRKGALSLIRSSLKYQIVISLAFFIALALSAERVGRIVLGKNSIATPSIVLPLAVGGFLWQMSYLVHKPLELMCLTKRMLVAMIAALAVSAAGNCFFIPLFGYVAAAYVAIAAPMTYLLVVVSLIPQAAFRKQLSVSDAVPVGYTLTQSQ